MTLKRPVMAALLVSLAAGLGAGCSLGGGGDKAGGSRAPEVLRLAVAYGTSEPGWPLARDFASRVAELSGGALRVRVVLDAAGQQGANPEAQVARMVRDGEFELGWIGSRAWDRLGVTSFQALQAPFLVTSHALLDRVATGPLASRMLAGLDGHGFVGLALVPDRMRYPTGVRRALASPDDFRGARVRVIPSRATDALMRALGATPVHVSSEDVDRALASGEIDGSEDSLGAPMAGGNFLTPNVTLFAKALTLFVERRAYERLDDEQRSVIRRAAQQTAAYAAAHPPSESALVRRFCEAARVVIASRDDVAALMRAARPVYLDLERDPQTKALIAAIRALKATTPSPPPTGLPANCAHAVGVPRGRALSPSTLNGTYHWRVTSAGARGVGGSPDSEDVGIVIRMTLRDGRWLMGDGDPDYSGSFKVTTNRIVFDWPAFVSTLTFTYKRHADGTLGLRPVLPMNLGDRVIWAGGRWRRVGPPVRDIPG